MTGKRPPLDESGATSTAVTFIVGGLSVVAIVATIWIGNTTAGMAADTANCVSRVGGQTEVDPSCSTNSATGAGGGNAIAADNGRPLGPAWIHDFGAGSGKYETSKLNQAKGNLERGLLRFSGLKLTAYDDCQPALARLQNASAKDAALAALQDIRVILTNARYDGETTTTDHTIQFAANLLRDMKHPAAQAAQDAQLNAITGLDPMRSAQAKAINATDNYSSMTLAQLKSLGGPISSDLSVGKEYYPKAIAKLNESMAIIDANR